MTDPESVPRKMVSNLLHHPVHFLLPVLLAHPQENDQARANLPHGPSVNDYVSPAHPLNDRTHLRFAPAISGQQSAVSLGRHEGVR